MPLIRRILDFLFGSVITEYEYATSATPHPPAQDDPRWQEEFAWSTPKQVGQTDDGEPLWECQRKAPVPTDENYLWRRARRTRIRLQRITVLPPGKPMLVAHDGYSLATD